MKLKIADLHIEVTGDLNPLFIERATPYEASFLKADITIKFRLKDQVELPDEYQTIAVTNDRTWATLPDGAFCYWDFNEQIGKHTLFTKIKKDKICIQFYHFQDAEEIRLINEALREYKKTMPNPKEYKNADKAAFKPEFPLINSTDQAMRYALLHHNGFMVHASAISYDGQGILFSAPSGTGKTTHTKLWEETYDSAFILNDDSPIIRFMEDGKAYACGSPWAGASGEARNVIVPLKAIVFLRQGETNEICRLQTLQALQWLLGSVNRPVEKGLMDKLFTLIHLLLSDTPCYLLKCRPDRDAVETVRNELFCND